jgi:hypothetical protein
VSTTDHETFDSWLAGDTGIARWWASFESVRSGKSVELDGIFVVRMGADGLCGEFGEW